jgi:L-serine dehydratase
MKYNSVFDIIGPVMIGPSSSHTAGAARIGLMARRIFGRQPQKAEILFLGSFAKTYKGHGTDIAIVGGLLGYNTYDKRIVNSLVIAKDLNMDVTIQTTEEVPNHPNTVEITLIDGEEKLKITGISIGGGKMEITAVNDYGIRLTGDRPTMLILHDDRYGVVAAVSEILSKHQINIGYMEMARLSKGCESLMSIETDQPLSAEICKEIEALPNILKLSSISAIE